MSNDERLVRGLTERGATLAVAESLTGGLLADRFARLPEAASWFRGGIVAYAEDVKRTVLDIGDVPVVSRASACAMAESAARLLDATAAVAVTGVGGPEPQDGQAPGTVWLATTVEGDTTAVCLELTGTPPEIVQQTCAAAVDAITTRIQRLPTGHA
jgi:nicotinamide-nucleotide amidase